MQIPTQQFSGMFRMAIPYNTKEQLLPLVTTDTSNVAFLK